MYLGRGFVSDVWTDPVVFGDCGEVSILGFVAADRFTDSAISRAVFEPTLAGFIFGRDVQFGFGGCIGSNAQSVIDCVEKHAWALVGAPARWNAACASQHGIGGGFFDVGGLFGRVDHAIA